MREDLEASMWLAHHQAFSQWVEGAITAIAGPFRGQRGAPGGTLLLTRRDVAGLMRPGDWLEAVETGFRAAVDGSAAAPPPMEIAGIGGAFHAKGASIALDRRYVALKLNGNFPGNPEQRGLPTIQGAILLCDGETGALLAIIDSIEVTLRRTAAATALAARYLARAESHSILVCGCGEQARAQVVALRAVLPLRRCLAWDRDPELARRFVDEVNGAAFATEAIAELPAGGDFEVIVTCTTATAPFLGPDHVSSGAFVAAVGADSPHKSEIEPSLFAQALVVADLREQCAAMGDLHHALAAGVSPECVHAELADLVTGAKPGRTSEDQITLFDSTGTALQDVAAAAMLHARARARGGRLRAITLGTGP